MDDHCTATLSVIDKVISNTFSGAPLVVYSSKHVEYTADVVLARITYSLIPVLRIPLCSSFLFSVIVVCLLVCLLQFACLVYKAIVKQINHE